MMTIIYLFLTLTLQRNCVTRRVDPIILYLCTLVPVVTLCIVKFCGNVTENFFSTRVNEMSLLFVLLVIICRVVVSLDLSRGLPHSIPVVFLFFFFT